MSNKAFSASVARTLAQEANIKHFSCTPFFDLMYDDIRQAAKDGKSKIWIDILQYEYVLNKSLAYVSRLHLLNNIETEAKKQGYTTKRICDSGEFVLEVSWAE